MRSGLLVAAALLLPIGTLGAQPPAGGPDAGWHQHREQDMAARRQEEERDLSIVLGLKPSQQPALATWLAAMHPPAGMDRHDAQDGVAPRTTPEMLQAKQAHIAEMQQFETGRIAATRTFYGTLDSRQQQVFDALDRLRHDRHGPHGHHGGHDHGGPGMSPPGGG